MFCRMRRLATVAFAGVLLAGCSTGSPPTKSTSSPATPAAGSSSPSAAAAFDVRTENARPGTTAWQIPAKDQADDHQMAGFLDHSSVLPGTAVVLRATTTAPSFTARAFRLGWYGGKGGALVWTSSTLPAITQPAPVIQSGNMVDCSAWKPSATISTTGWAPGLYVIKLTSSAGKSKWVPLTVRSRTTAGTIVIANATPTYQAYNAWGGYSLYTGPKGFGDRATRVSFDRPYDRSGARHVMAGERQVTALAEKLGLPLSYETQLDIDADPSLLNGARGALSLGHDEYWTVGMRQAWTNARDHGTNLAFFGANAVYWRIRAQGRTIITYKSAASDPVQGEPSTTAMWRSAPHPDPENSLTGLLYECFPARGPLVVTDPSLWLFKGTGATAGSSYTGLVGVEIDRAYPIAGTPSTLQVGAHSPVECGQIGPTHSDLAYYTVPSGAGVFSSGSMLFAVGILGPNQPSGIDQKASDFATQVSANLLTAMAAGPLGRSHPAVPNLAGLNPPVSTRTGTGGSIG